MADIGIWGLGAIASPAATDRLPLESGVGAGGYSARGDFFHKTSAGFYLAKGAGEIAIFETTAPRGTGNGYVSIYDPTGRKCYIGYGTSSDALTLVNEMNGPLILGTNVNYRWQIGASGNLEPYADNTYNIGIASTGRIKDLFLVNSPTVTSDATEKEWLGAGFSPALLSAAKRIAAEIGSYKWLAAIARENDGGPAARIHFGPRAQAVWAIMADEGLIDPIEEGVTPSCPYAFLCYDEWEADAEAGIDAGHRFGIRPDQLAMFLIAAQEARLTALEALITEGE